MPETPETGAASASDPLSTLGQRIEQEIRDGTLSPDQVETLRDAIQPHGEAMLEQLGDLREYVKTEPDHIKDVLLEPVMELYEAHREAGVFQNIQPAEVATVGGPYGTEMLNVTQHLDTVVLDLSEEQLGAWRDLVEARAEMGGESPEAIQAQRDQVETLQTQIDDARDQRDEAYDWAHEQHDAKVDYVIEHNDDSVLHPPETIDADDYNMPAAETDTTAEA